MYQNFVFMKNVFIGMLLLFVSSFVFSQTTEKTTEKRRFDPTDIIKFDVYYKDFGEVKWGDVIETTYTFTNVGKEDIEIELVSTCDCTETDYPVWPIHPGEGGEIKVKFYSARKEKSGVINIDVILKNENPDNGYPVVERVEYKYELIK